MKTTNIALAIALAEQLLADDVNGGGYGESAAIELVLLVVRNATVAFIYEVDD